MADEQVTEVSSELRAKAIDMGWVDKPDFQGDPDKWIPADQYVDRGEHLLPILHSTNRRLKSDVESLKGKAAELEDALRQGRETIAALETYHEEDVKRKVEAARASLRTQLADANRSGDHDAVATITEEMTRLNAAEGDRKEEKKPAPAANKVSNEELARRQAAFTAFTAANSWYGVDTAKTGIADAVGTKLRKDGDTSYGEEFYRKVQAGFETEWARITGGQRRESKVEGGGATGGNGSGSGTSGKGYADLSQEAKIACDSYEKALVGPNKPYKTLADWRKKYAKDHFSEI